MLTTTPPPTTCICNHPIKLGSVRWNGERWEHTTDPRAGHHAMQQGEAVPGDVVRGLFAPNLFTRKFESDSKEDAYADRNLAVLSLAMMARGNGYNVGVRDRTSDWPIITVDLPTGQVTWHVPRDHVPDALPDYSGPAWDGHDLAEKRKRLSEWLTGRWEGAFRLCYIDDDTATAYFTTQPLAEAWGDDWDDAPYEHNAGTPYVWDMARGIGCKCNGPGGNLYLRSGGGGACGEPSHTPVPGKPLWRIMRLRFSAPLLATPRDGLTNSPFSVRDINAGDAPWLRRETRGERDSGLMAGATPADFRRYVTQHGGTVYGGEPPVPCLPS